MEGKPRIRIPDESFGPKSPFLKNTIGVIKEAIAKKPKAPSTHPPYNEMIKKAINSCKERATRRSILDYIMRQYDVGSNEKVVENRLKFSIRIALQTGFLHKKDKTPGQSVVFKLGNSRRPKSSSKAKAQKKKKTQSRKKVSRRPKASSRSTKSSRGRPRKSK